MRSARIRGGPWRFDSFACAGPLLSSLNTGFPAGPVSGGPEEVPVAVLAGFSGRGPAHMTSRSLRRRGVGRPDLGPGWWLPVYVTVALVGVAAFAIGQLWKGGLVFGPLLAIPPALAGIGAATVRPPLTCGAVMLVTAIVLATFAGGSLPWVAGPLAGVAVTALSAA